MSLRILSYGLLALYCLFFLEFCLRYNMWCGCVTIESRLKEVAYIKTANLVSLAPVRGGELAIIWHCSSVLKRAINLKAL